MKDRTLLKLWDKAVGTHDYDKKQWRKLQSDFWNYTRLIEMIKEEVTTTEDAGDSILYIRELLGVENDR